MPQFLLGLKLFLHFSIARAGKNTRAISESRPISTGGKLEMNILRGMLLTLLLLSSPFLSCVLAAPPTIQRQMEIVNAEIEGGGPATIDPAAAYDFESGELIMNIYETLVFFDGEHMDKYLPQLADNWTVENITGTTSPDGIPWYFRYTFHIRPNVHFWNGKTLTPEDVEYCFERGMVLEPGDNPQWMFYEPLLNTGEHSASTRLTLDGNSTEQARVWSNRSTIRSNPTARTCGSTWPFQARMLRSCRF